jgi:hypothetical protein
MADGVGVLSSGGHDGELAEPVGVWSSKARDSSIAAKNTTLIPTAQQKITSVWRRELDSRG